LGCTKNFKGNERGNARKAAHALSRAGIGRTSPRARPAHGRAVSCGAWFEASVYPLAIGHREGDIYVIVGDGRLIRELRLLERRTHRSGKDTVEHPRNGHDDHANVVCGVLSLAADTEAPPK
jgi:hypothetical protein